MSSSNLTRYSMKVGGLIGGTGSGVRAWGMEDVGGEWVRADEAEALIAGRDERIRELEAAADELRDAVLAYSKHGAIKWGELKEAVTAYREAAQIGKPSCASEENREAGK